MYGNETVIKALEFLSNSEVACAWFYNDSYTATWCCLEALTCLDMTFYPEIYHDVDALTRDDDICWSTKYLLGCISENLNTFCDRYQSIMEQTFGHHIRVIIDKYSYNGSCYEDYGDYDDYSTDDYVTLESTTSAFKQSTSNDNGAIIGGCVGAVLVIVLILSLLFVYRRSKRKGTEKGTEENDNAAYNLAHRGSVDYAEIREVNMDPDQARYVKLKLGHHENQNVTYGLENDQTGEHDASVFTIATDSPKPGYDGLSNFQRHKMERQYTTLSENEGNDYILRPESVPDLRPMMHIKDENGVNYQDGHDYFVPEADTPPLTPKSARYDAESTHI
ncbi:uncharacterized protein [Mytilus edulis]|uniref:uncharacterized protein n=1 Tax=Mytilus edulis TaxID=6550 RepID=UPI0039F11FD0